MSRYRTPLRYPGGKQRLAPFILEIMRCNDPVGGHYVEPYAGGAGVACELLIDGHVETVHINDSSLQIYSFWHSVLYDTESLCRRISSASLDVDEWKRRREIVRNPASHDLLELGFSTLYLNRCNRSGVLSGGLIGGIAQDGEWKMDARFSRNGLIARIEAIASMGASVALYNMDAEQFIRKEVSQLPDRVLVYCDPPYYDKSSRLYLDRYCKEDHARIATVIQAELGKKWVVSYDYCDEVVRMYKSRNMVAYDLQYSASRSYVGKELFVFSNDVKVPKTSSIAYVDAALKSRVEMPC